jgi:hypothetical protein
MPTTAPTKDKVELLQGPRPLMQKRARSELTAITITVGTNDGQISFLVPQHENSV